MNYVDMWKIHICDLCVLHELCGCVSNKLLEKMIFHKIHNCDLFGLHELCGCVSSSVLLQKMIYHKNHICNLCCLHELWECVHLSVLFDKMIFYISNIDDFLLLMYSKQTNFPQVFKSKLKLVLHVPAKNSKKLLRQTLIPIKFWITFV